MDQSDTRVQARVTTAQSNQAATAGAWPGALAPGSCAAAAAFPLLWRDWPGVLSRRSLVLAALVLVVGLAGFVRFVRLDDWPVFVDEDLSTQRAIRSMDQPLLQALLNPPRRMSKPPLLFVLQGRLARPLNDPVLAGRALAALAGLLTTVLCGLLGWRLGGAGAGVLSAALYAVAPLAVLHERMALQDGPMTALVLASVLLSWVALQRGSWLAALGAALGGALAVQIKVPAAAVAALPLLALALYGWRKGRLVAALLAASGPAASYLALTWGPQGPALAAQNRDRMSAPFALLGSNLAELSDVVWLYLPAGLILVVVAGAVLALRLRPRAGLFLLAALGLWTIPWPIVAAPAFSRYYLPGLPFACALAALALARLIAVGAARGLLPGAVGLAVTLGVLAASASTSWQLVSAHAAAPMSKIDDQQYRRDWPAGYGYQEVAPLLERLAGPGSAVAYLVDPRHELAALGSRPLPRGVKSLGLIDPRKQIRLRHPGPTFLVVDEWSERVKATRLPELRAREPRLESLAELRRPGGDLAVSVLRLPPD